MFCIFCIVLLTKLIFVFCFAVEWKIFFCEIAILPKLISEIKKRIPIFNVPALNYIYEMFKVSTTCSIAEFID